jgi:hypothetical protein
LNLMPLASRIGTQCKPRASRWYGTCPLAPRMTLLDQIAMASSAILILALLALVVSAAVSVAPVALRLLGH